MPGKNTVTRWLSWSGPAAVRMSWRREFEPTDVTIQKRGKQADPDGGNRQDRATTIEREELRRQRRENKRLGLEQEILAHHPGVPSVKATAVHQIGVIPKAG